MDGDSSQPRVGQLDGLRAFSVMAVIFSHTIPETYKLGGYVFYEIGSYGVYLFFVLSGYLITGQLLVTRAKRLDWQEGALRPLLLFYGKRMLRLFPAYYLAIVGAVILAIPGMREEFWWHAAQASDILFAIDPVREDSSAAGHFWSLTVEWQFYLAWPLVILLAPARLVPWTIALVAAVSAYSWSPVAHLAPVVERTNILQSLDSLAFGAALAYGEHRRWRLDWLRRAAWPAAAIVLGHIGFFVTGHARTGEALAMPAHEAMNLLFTAIVFQALGGFGGRTGALLDWAPLRYVGVISYGIYVYHEFIIALFQQAYARLGWGELNWGAGLTVEIFAVSTLAAALSWRYVEQPVNRLRRGLAYHRRPVPAGALQPVTPA